MKRTIIALMLGLLVWTAARVARSEEAPPEPVRFGVEAGNRLYPEWHESYEVALGEAFYLGDTDFSARIEEFLPDFRIIDGKPVSLSEELSNPAIHVYVYADTGAVDSTWAFLNFPPHFSPRSFFTFQLKEVLGFADSTATPED
jgi:hypothetical protein